MVWMPAPLGVLPCPVIGDVSNKFEPSGLTAYPCTHHMISYLLGLRDVGWWGFNLCCDASRSLRALAWSVRPRMIRGRAGPVSRSLDSLPEK